MRRNSQSRAAPPVRRAAARFRRRSPRLSVGPSFSPRAAQARNAFSRRSRRLENCRNGSMLERDSVMPRCAGMPRSAASRPRDGEQRVGQAGEILRRLQRQHIGLFIGQNVLAELRAERREALVDLREPRLGFGRKPRAIAHEGDMIELRERAPVRRSSPRLSRRRIERVDAAKQRLVEIDFAAEPRKHRRHVALDRLDRVVAVGAGEIEKHRRDPVELRAAALQRLDRIGEGRRARDWPRWRRFRRAFARERRRRRGGSARARSQRKAAPGRGWSRFGEGGWLWLTSGGPQEILLSQ